MTAGSERTVFQCAARGCDGCTVCRKIHQAPFHDNVTPEMARKAVKEVRPMKDFTEQAEVEWCEECQNFFPVVDGVTECDCNLDCSLPNTQELDFND
jgi:hypothetical protein